MTIKYHSFSIQELEHVQTKEKFHRLVHWYGSDVNPEILGSHEIGIFKSKKEAIQHHCNIILDKLKEPE
jgi:hypothetical protein